MIIISDLVLVHHHLTLTFTALLADVLLLARVNDDVKRQLLLPFEGFHANLRRRK